MVVSGPIQVKAVPMLTSGPPVPGSIYGLCHGHAIRNDSLANQRSKQKYSMP